MKIAKSPFENNWPLESRDWSSSWPWIFQIVLDLILWYAFGLDIFPIQSGFISLFSLAVMNIWALSYMKTNFLTYHVYIFIQFVIKFLKFIFPEKATKITMKSYQVIYFVKFMAPFSDNLNFNFSILLARLELGIWNSGCQSLKVS